MKTRTRTKSSAFVPEHIQKACEKIFADFAAPAEASAAKPDTASSVEYAAAESAVPWLVDRHDKDVIDDSTPDSLEDQRVTDLNAEIHQLFAEMSSNELSEYLAPCWETITEMIEITHVGRELCEAIHLFDDVKFDRIKFPKTVHALLAPGDVFLVTMGKMETTWDVYFSSPRYETEILEFEGVGDDELH